MLAVYCAHFEAIVQKFCYFLKLLDFLKQFYDLFLKFLYDDDILEDTSIIKWAEKPTKKFVKKSFVEKMIENCEKLVAWMKEADSSDEESSSEEESESENEAGEQQSKVAEKQQEEASSKEEPEAKTPEAEEAPKPKPAAAAKVNTLLDDDDSDDDIDIDDI